MRQAENRVDALIIGGGASGLAAACVLGQRGLRTLVLEKEARVGRKLLATGNGRCNLLNTGTPAYYGQPAFAEKVLAACPAWEVLRFFGGLGLTTREEVDGRVYPATGQAASVLDVLRFSAEEGGARILTGVTATEIRPCEKGFEVFTRKGDCFFAPRVLAAGGGKAAPRLGGGGMYKQLEKLGHRVTPLRPALSPLETDRESVRGLRGLRLPAVCVLRDGSQSAAAAGGEVLFTDYGLSGICVMQLSRKAGELMDRGRPVRVEIDFSPLLFPPLGDKGGGFPEVSAGDSAPVLAFLQQRAQRLSPSRLLVGAVPRPIADRLGELPTPRIAELLSAWPVRVTGVRGFEQAQVTAGGVDTKDVDPLTLGSKLVPGLHFAGELLDVDGDCGGFNLLFAWASGILAARAMSGRDR